MLPPPTTTEISQPAEVAFGYVASETLGDGHVDAEIAFAHQGFAGELEQQPTCTPARMRLLPSWLP